MMTIRTVKVRVTGFADIGNVGRSTAFRAAILWLAGSASGQCSGTWQALTAFNSSTVTARTTFLGPMFVSPVDGSLQLAACVTDRFTNTNTAAVWRLDGVAWPVVATGGLTYRTQMQGAFDEGRGRLVVFGGFSNTELNDTWEWDGRDWIEATPAGVRPSGRVRHAMAYDPVRHRIVLQGGRGGSTNFYDTWEWDGASWEVKSTAFTGPATDATMAFDPVSQRVLLHGGSGSLQSCSDCTYAWNGVTWARVASNGPHTTARCSMTIDPVRGRVLLFGGATSGATASSTWEWTGTAWSLLSSVGPRGRYNAAMCFAPARGEIVLAGGQASAFEGEMDIWSWNGASWAQSPQFETIVNSAYAIDPVRRRIVGFSGVPQAGSVEVLSVAREWNGATWRSVSAAGPAPRRRAGMAWHAGLGQLVLFGGLDGSGQALSDTWLFDGLRWSRLEISGPSARGSHLMAWDTRRDRVVCYGGTLSGDVLQDTWEFDGVAWHQMATAGPLTGSKSMAFDQVTSRMVLFAGASSPNPLAAETWTWDGQSWERLPIPPGLADVAGPMTYDPVTSRVLLLCPPTNGAIRGVFELTSRGWRSFAPLSPSAGSIGDVFSYDPTSGQLIYNFPVGAASERATSLMFTAAISRPAIISPDVTEQPSAVTAHHNAPVTLSVRASGTPPFTYQWRRNQTPLADGPRISGATADTLRIDAADAADSGAYDCVVANECAQIESFPATVQVACAADFNQDGGVDGADVEAFFVAWENADPSSDLNADGGIDGGDVEYFFTRWEAGC